LKVGHGGGGGGKAVIISNARRLHPAGERKNARNPCQSRDWAVLVTDSGPLDPSTGQIVGTTIDEQTKRVMDNLAAVLAANGMSMANVVSTTVYLRDLNDFSAMNKVYGTYFGANPPARATVQVARLPKDVAIEISAIATK